jgi:hypothetical protein
LLKVLPTWILTVGSTTYRAAAVSAFVVPRAISQRVVRALGEQLEAGGVPSRRRDDLPVAL